MKRLTLFVLLLALAMPWEAKAQTGNISFSDANVKAICVQYWDSNHDGELSYSEAAAVTSLGTRFQGKQNISHFHEFQYFTNVTSLVTDNDYGTFHSCSSLIALTLPNSLTNIGKWAFCNCHNLIMIEIPSAVTIIDEEAFMDCWELRSVTYRNGVNNSVLNTIGQGAFRRCYDLLTFSIPNNVEEINANTFSGCSVMHTIDNIPPYLYYIGDNAFYGCSFLHEMNIPYVETVGNEAFFGCTELTTVYIPNVTSIGSQAFYNCSNLTTVDFTTHLTSIGDGAFQSCSSLQTLSIPSSVTSIGASVFQSCTNLSSVTIPSSVTSIGESAFRSCTRLSSLTIPNTVTTIGQYAFAGCSRLTSVVIPNSITTIPSHAFDGCSGLSEVLFLGNTQTSIGEYAFSGCSGLTSVTIPSSMTTIYNNAFADCSNLTSVTIYSNAVASATYEYDNNLRTRFGNQVTSYSFNGNVTAIGKDAFYNCTGMTSVNIPESVTSIGFNAFCGCSGLTSVTIPNSVTSIEEYAFDRCSGLTQANYTGTLGEWCNISFSNKYSNPLYFAHNLYIDNELVTTPNFTTNGTNVTSINPYAFAGCTGLNSVNIASFVTYIGNHAFKDCTSLTSVTIRSNDVLTATFSDSYNLGTIFGTQVESYTINGYGSTWVTSIGKRAFSDCTGMTSLTMGTLTDVTSIGNYAFYNCSGLTSFTIPYSYTSTTSIGNSAFENCSGLQSINCGPDIPPTLGTNVFQGVDPTIPVNVPCNAKAAYQAANGWSAFTNIVDPCEAIQFEDPYVKEICVNYGNWDFNNDDELSYLEAAAVTSLGIAFKENAFIISFNELQYFTGLESLNTTAGYGTFQSCPQLTSIVLPNSLTSIGDEAFSDCSSLTSIVIPNSVTSIGNAAFSDCESLTSIVLPDSLTSIGNNAFYGCSSLASIEIPNSVTSIGNYAFYWCVSLTSIEIPDSVTSIGNYMFYNCSSLTSIEISNSVTSIGNYAFNGCSGLTSLSIPNSVASIGQNAFGNCQGLTSIEVATGNATYDSRNNCNAIIETNTNTLVAGCQNTVIPSTVTSIGNCAFSDCSGLTSIEIPNSVTSIGNSAFSYCSGLTSIEIPNSVTSIGNSAFSDCDGLTSMTVQATTPPTLGSDVFQNVPTSIPVTVPCGSLSNYQNATGWSNFTNLVENCTQQLTVNDGTVENSYVPVYGYWCDQYSKSQFIIPASDLQTLQQNVITKLTFYSLQSNVSWDDALFDVYLAEVEETEFEDATLDWTGMTKVLENASLSIADNKMEVLLSQPYLYQGGNLKVGIKQVVSGSYVSCTWFGVSNENNVAIGGYEYTRALSLYPFLPKTTFDYIISTAQSNIEFADPNVKAICVAHWDTNGDGELSYEEAAAVTTLKPSGTHVFKNNTTITSFDELQYFTGLTSIEIDLFLGCTSLASVTLPSTITQISNHAFDGCTSLASIIIPSMVINIGPYAFDGCTGLTSIIIEGELEYIRNYAFRNCTSLTFITLNATTPPSFGQQPAFGNVPTDIPVYVPCESLETYQTFNNGQPWGGFSNIQCDDCTAELPLSENFDSYPGVTSGTVNVLPDCWSRINTTTVSSQQGYPTITEYSYAQSAPNFLYFMSSYVVGSYEDPQDQYAILPSVDNVSNLVLSLSARIPAGGRNGTFMVGVMTDPTDASTFTPLATFAPTTTTYQQYTVAFNSYSGEGHYIAIKMPAASSDVYYRGLCIDDVTLDIVSSPNIVFADANVKAICVQNWDTNNDGELSYDEAAMVNDIGDVFSENDEITSFNELQYFTGLTAIEYEAFYYCTNLTSVIIPSGVTTIVSEAFYECTNLHSVTIPSGVTEIGYNAFYACTSLVSISLPNTLTFIDEFAFEDCTSLTSITIPSSVNYIEGNPLKGCPALASIIVEADNTVYDSRNDCNAIIETASNTLQAGCKNTVIPSTVTSIGYTAFEECISLASITIPSSVTSIGQYAFYGCTSLASISLSNGLTTIYSSAFYGCSSLTSITIPSSVTSIGNYAFKNCTGLTSITVEATTPPTLGNNAFQNVPTSIPVYVPCGTKAAYQAAAGWNAFTNIVDPCEAIVFADPAVKALCVANWDTNGDGELSYPEAAAVTSLGSVFYEESITTFDELQYFTGLEYIDDEAFANCTQLTSVIIPSSVTFIAYESFWNCSSLTSVTIPGSVTTIGDEAFYDCSSLTSVTIPGSVTTIGYEAFSDCSSLTSIIISNGVTTIGYDAFYGCSSLTSVTIPSTVTTMIGNLFPYCPALASITVEAGNTVYDSRDNCNAIIETATNTLIAGCKNTVIPNTVTTIGGSAFYACTGLTSITIPSGVSTIGHSAFNSCNGLTSITIPSTVTSIGSSAFSGCSGLTEMTVEATTPPTLNTYAFQNVPTDIPVYVPCGTKAAYQAAAGWSAFTNFVDPCASQPQMVTLAAGTNWFSSNVEITLADLQNALTDVLGTNASITISSQTQSCTLKRNRWTGTLETIDLSQMYMIEIENACEISLEGEPINPANHPVTISFGENWVAFPLNVAMSLDDAFDGFAQNDDAVSSQTQNASRKRNKWTGTLTELQPGQGFIYTSSVNGDRTLVFPTSK